MATRSSTTTRSTNTRSASGGSLKEKRGTSPSNSHTQKKTITRSASDAKEKSSSSTAEKHIPNYLKPTLSLSSRHDQPSKPNSVKQSGNGTTTEDQKLLIRRRSFDKPPSSSPRVQKALISPPARPRDRTAPLLPKERAGAMRSSSFSGRSNTTSTVSSRPVLDRSATSLSSKLSLDSRSSFAPRTPKAVKPQPVFTSRTAKKSAKTKDCNASPSSSSPSKTLNQEAKQEEEENPKECQNGEVVEDKVEGDHVVEVHDHNDVMPKLENNEEDHDHENDKMVDDKTSEEVPTVLEDENVVKQAAHHVEETEEKSHEEEKLEENSKEIDVVVVEGGDHDDGHEHDHQNEEITQDSEEKGEETSDDHETEDENKVEEKAVEGGEKQGGGEEVANEEEDRNGNSAISTPHKAAGGQGIKKESPSAYNDVIEETASKLLEKRKNKVKALVGAFETVIDYESGASK